MTCRDAHIDALRAAGVGDDGFMFIQLFKGSSEYPVTEVGDIGEQVVQTLRARTQLSGDR